ncbi:hypothetical protein EBZ39_03130 [bacterium]|nr:hypothetical protein [bacterium]
MAVVTADFTSTNDSLSFSGQSPPMIHIGGTWSGMLVFENSVRPNLWVTLNTYTGNGGDVAKVKEGAFRARLTSYSSGTVNVAISDSVLP